MSQKALSGSRKSESGTYVVACKPEELGSRHYISPSATWLQNQSLCTCQIELWGITYAYHCRQLTCSSLIRDWHAMMFPISDTWTQGFAGVNDFLNTNQITWFTFKGKNNLLQTCTIGFSCSSVDLPSRRAISFVDGLMTQRIQWPTPRLVWEGMCKGQNSSLHERRSCEW